MNTTGLGSFTAIKDSGDSKSANIQGNILVIFTVYLFGIGVSVLYTAFLVLHWCLHRSGPSITVKVGMLDFKVTAFSFAQHIIQAATELEERVSILCILSKLLRVHGLKKLLSNLVEKF